MKRHILPLAAVFLALAGLAFLVIRTHRATTTLPDRDTGEYIIPDTAPIPGEAAPGSDV